jgi:hypothetical protein
MSTRSPVGLGMAGWHNDAQGLHSMGSESAQRATRSLFARPPARPDAEGDPRHRGEAIHERVAAELRAQIASGQLPIDAGLGIIERSIPKSRQAMCGGAH